MPRVKDPADPRRCKGNQPDGQCKNYAEPEAEYCQACGGVIASQARQRRMYQLTQARHRKRLSELANHDEVKTLHEEVGLTRILIEELWNSCTTQTDLLQACHPFNQLVSTLERLMKTSHTLEQNLGLLLSKTTVIVIAQDIVNILIEEMQGVPEYEQRIDRITERMLSTIESATNTDE